MERMPFLRSGRDALEGAAEALHGERPVGKGAVGCVPTARERQGEERSGALLRHLR